jgi:hypothetical protein
VQRHLFVRDVKIDDFIHARTVEKGEMFGHRGPTAAAAVGRNELKAAVEGVRENVPVRGGPGRDETDDVADTALQLIGQLPAHVFHFHVVPNLRRKKGGNRSVIGTDKTKTVSVSVSQIHEMAFPAGRLGLQPADLSNVPGKYCHITASEQHHRKPVNLHYVVYFTKAAQRKST